MGLGLLLYVVVLLGLEGCLGNVWNAPLGVITGNFYFSHCPLMFAGEVKNYKGTRGPWVQSHTIWDSTRLPAMCLQTPNQALVYIVHKSDRWKSWAFRGLCCWGLWDLGSFVVSSSLRDELGSMGCSRDMSTSVALTKEP